MIAKSLIHLLLKEFCHKCIVKSTCPREKSLLVLPIDDFLSSHIATNADICAVAAYLKITNKLQWRICGVGGCADSLALLPKFFGLRFEVSYFLFRIQSFNVFRNFLPAPSHKFDGVKALFCS